jgi:hypothetical protein
VMCVLTRFHLRSIWSTLQFIYWFYKVRSSARSDEGLLWAGMLFGDTRTCYSLSIWKDERAILRFNTNAKDHITAANGSFQHLRLDSEGVHLWSGQFRLHALSPHNLRWEGMPIDSAFREQNATRGGRPGVKSEECAA